MTHVSEPVNTITIRLCSDPKLLKIVRAGIAHLCELAGFSEEQRHRVTLAVDEACTNIIKHAYNGATDKPILITARLIENGIEVVLRDYGKKTDPESIKSRDLDDIRPGGLGVHLIHSAMDSVVYDNTLPDGNQLILKKYLRKQRSDSLEEIR
ncbi:MAG: ATP-binding protein [candidate division KSB1 bacterium]|nr:ATP-binding protein [candidate division KSB1 bacterium]MDZ7301418.1 ATP-binding protein [candidate division KSB1 bacterium]MDZ7313452.1 ATP-binding protein [candidate division KSB1 bacterium]